MLTVNTQLIWHGNQVKKGITTKLHNGLTKAIEYYKLKLKEKISIWGSIIVGYGGAGFLTRESVIHAAPGQPPFRQTGNLYESIESHVDSVTVLDEQFYQIQGEISTDVEYAPTLELGGSLQIPQSEKRHTWYRLINPFPKAVTIAPRPVWIPLFNELIQKMVDFISK